MINWERVLINFKVITSLEGTLEEVLKELYLKKGLSLEDIANLAPQEVCYLSIRKKLLEFKIPLRQRGGRHK